MITEHELTEAFQVLSEMVKKFFKALEDFRKKILEIFEAFENENQPENRQPCTTTVISVSDRIPPLGPRRTGRRMGGRTGW
jgi:hypothetical protein